MKVVGVSVNVRVCIDGVVGGSLITRDNWRSCDIFQCVLCDVLLVVVLKAFPAFWDWRAEFIKRPPWIGGGHSRVMSRKRSAISSCTASMDVRGYDVTRCKLL